MTSKSGKSLKRATPKMKYHHMHLVMAFKSDLRDRQDQGMTEGTREYMLIEIKRMMGGLFHSWFDKVYEFRRNGDMPAYEKKIKTKYYYLRKREKERTLDPLPQTESMNAPDASRALSSWMESNWKRIQEIPL